MAPRSCWPTSLTVRPKPLGGMFVETEVADPQAVERLVADAVERFEQLDVYFNNAGIDARVPLAAADLAEHRRAMMNNDPPLLVVHARAMHHDQQCAASSR